MNFDALWLQGEGNCYETFKSSKRPPNVIEVGNHDNWHLKGAKALKNQLIKQGWILDKNLLFYESEKGHQLDTSKLCEHVEFLIKESELHSVHGC